jgi:hypothetical protein
MRKAPSCCQLLQEILVPRGAETGLYENCLIVLVLVFLIEPPVQCYAIFDLSQEDGGYLGY